MGKTAAGRLHGFMAFRYSWRGTTNARLVTSSPLPPSEGIPDYGGEKKSMRGPDGKYRHTASYSLDECEERKEVPALDELNKNEYSS